MAIKKTDKDKFSVKEDPWSQEIVAQFGERIPILPGILKSDKSIYARYMMSSVDDYIAKKLVEKHRKFGNLSECLRAATHIGLQLIYHMLMSASAGKISKDLEFAYKISVSSEIQVANAHIVDTVTNAISKLDHSAKLGILSFEERDEKAEEIVSEIIEIRPDLKKVLQSKMKQVLNGHKVTDIYECKTHGGTRE